MSVAIKVENLSKAYQLGEIGTGTLSRDLERYWAKLRGKEDPFLKIGEANDRTQKGTSDMVWSLKDLNFEIEQGDAVGIIGRNGAGKSTLLKILSRVTSPTTGSVKIKGRVASLLEVGTGFHPELTGRENIFLNGTILGMRKAEIKKHFDAIVDFSGVERYIDTPVKRYSSGMYVRLAFAVAAHLESEILVVDEVLAVGDAEFQKKCLGKMNDVSKGEGRTVLFVSHNMDSIEALCGNSMLLKNGTISNFDKTNNIIEQYIHQNFKTNDLQAKLDSRQGKRADTEIMDFKLFGKDNTVYDHNESLVCKTNIFIKSPCKYFEFGLAVSNFRGQRFHHLIYNNSEEVDIGNYELILETKGLKFYPSEYYLTIWTRTSKTAPVDDYFEQIETITIRHSTQHNKYNIANIAGNGGVFLDHAWEITSK
jgi:ABC-type polysaccharide/polyol phosphate transport system ATPase subunit